MNAVFPESLFASPFRVFFLSSALWAVFAIPIWVASLNGIVVLGDSMGGLHWHQREMLFGFINPAIAGFFLTAVCNWTKTEPLCGKWLFGLWCIWLLGRMVGFQEILPSEPLYLFLNLAFLPLVILDGGVRIARTRQSRQYPLMLLLFALWLCQIGILLSLLDTLFPACLILIAMLMLLIGGRITPAFSINWAKHQGLKDIVVNSHQWLENLMWLSMCSLFVSILMGWEAYTPFVAIIAASACLLRSIRWGGLAFRSEPLLWILHLSLLWVPFSLYLLALSYFSPITSSVWVHSLTVGAVGGLLLGIFTRVPLGHTGRPLVLPQGVVISYFLIQVSAIVRVATAMGFIPWNAGIWVSGIFWVMAFLLFLVRYLSILISPRVDNRAG